MQLHRLIDMVRGHCPPLQHRRWRRGPLQLVPMLALLCLATLTACSRPMTEAEESFANDLFGDTLNTSQVRVAQGLGVTPLYRTVPSRITRVTATDRSCVRTPQPRGGQPPQAFAFRNGVYFDSQLYSSDMVLEWPTGLRIPQALILAHELTHVWQWQNRSKTGYSATRAVAESLALADPYFSDGDAAFFAFGFEQQAAIVEDFVCFTFANPTHPRRAELRAILEPVLPVADFEAALGR